MLLATLQTIFERDLNRVIDELNQYQTEEDIWKIENGISNAAGNLTLHVIGNLTTYIGKEIGKIEYVRNRELEFSQKNISRKELIDKISLTKGVIEKSLTGLSEADLNKEYPLLVLSEKTSTAFFLVHLTSHLAYHLGQINYHRRLLG
jgi:hypothetical protein